MTLPIYNRKLNRRFKLSGEKTIVAILLRILAAILTALVIFPVLLLPNTTTVPSSIQILFAMAEVAWLVAMSRLGFNARTFLVELSGFVAITLLAIFASQVFASTPPILDVNGKPIASSIAVLETVNLNGSEQWISIRGKDAHNPVVLFLAGGPGGSQLVTERRALARLEDHFVVVNWEQPGAGKSFDAVDRSKLTPDRYVTDAHELVLTLRQRFGKDKVYVLGESWGSALGIMVVQRYPELFHAFIGTGQMVAFLENDLICYNFALRLAAERGDIQKVERLKKQGPPPYYDSDVALKSATYLMETFNYMNKNPAITNAGFNTLQDLAGPEYGLYDKINFVRGLLDTFGVVYPQLWDVDFRKQAKRLEVPIYFLIGRHDVNAPPKLTEEYFNLLTAPHKELIWFEHSGHNPWMNESEKFVDVMVNKIISQ
ncbi:MAG: putative hydrolases or acyltransferases (alpha/beta hydrolase superfamily) [Phormidesmis priestleyi Ana]|uniref:prolyl aminopeptidase n=1 Tax=Phormidesmis priestleyi Ana TaxID=1666911 RepID=A0A0N8KM06_9CYAN|nr:MAG: putative hydrolases or acyltransferases (alpha/beta hydrolase superfamily) [Phormidesmis priestleyi Ana]